MVNAFRLLCWVPAAVWVYARAVVGEYEGWGAWAAAPLLLVPVVASALFVGAALLLLTRSGGLRSGWPDWIALGVAALPLLWIAVRVISA